MILSDKRITKTLIRLRVWAGWSGPLLFEAPPPPPTRGGQVFDFIFYLLKNRWGRQVFYFLKNRRGMYLYELLYSPTMFHGRCTTAPDDIWTDTRAMLDIKSGYFLEKRPFMMEDALSCAGAILKNIWKMLPGLDNAEDAIIKKDVTLVYLH